VGGEARPILTRMSRRIDKSWVVLRSIENGEHDRCAAVKAVAWLGDVLKDR